MPEITGLLLAAGRSSRFGSQKLLADLDGFPMIVYGARALKDCDRIIAVIRDDEPRLGDILKSEGIETVINQDADLGMGHTIACGVRVSAESDGWCILPADMPVITAEAIQHINHALRKGAQLAAPYYQGQRGHPVGFSRPYFQELAALDSDTGARSILNAHQERIVRIDSAGPGILIDIDTPEELEGLSTAQSA